MAQSIPSQIAAINSHSSVSLPTTTNLIRKLPTLHFRLLSIFYEDRILGIEKSDRSIQELGRRFNRDPKYISRCLKDLENWGCLQGDPHGSGIKKRWITMCAFIELDTKNTNQITNQIQPIPYIDLKDQDYENTLKILEEPQICGQLEEPDLNEKLNTILAEQRVPHQDRITIKNAINRTLLSDTARLDFTNKVGWVMKKKRIQSPRAYFLKALQNESMTRGFQDVRK